MLSSEFFGDFGQECLLREFCARRPDGRFFPDCPQKPTQFRTVKAADMGFLPVTRYSDCSSPRWLSAKIPADAVPGRISFSHGLIPTVFDNGLRREFQRFSSAAGAGLLFVPDGSGCCC